MGPGLGQEHRRPARRQRELQPGPAREEVAFTSTQALWSSVVRAAGLTSERAEAAGGADVPALRAWCERMRERESRLLPVANVYATPRLWANTEWAAFVLLDKDVFVPTDNDTGA